MGLSGKKKSTEQRYPTGFARFYHAWLILTGVQVVLGEQRFAQEFRTVDRPCTMLTADR
jgi:hypothetical protein